MGKRLLVLQAVAALVPALLLMAPALSAEQAGSSESTRRPPQDGDRRLPKDEIKSPGFPSALTGKCTTMQDCAAYCKQHPSENGCIKETPRKPAP